MSQINETSPDNVIFSKLGILSLVLGFGPLCVFLCYAGFIYIFISAPSMGGNVPIPAIILLSLVCGSILGLLSVILGIASFFREDQSRIPPVLGILLAIFGCALLPIILFSALLFMS